MMLREWKLRWPMTFSKENGHAAAPFAVMCLVRRLFVIKM